MLRLNQVNKTITGELLTPYLVEGKNVLCWNRSGKSVTKGMNDFSLKGPSAKESMNNGTAVSLLPITPVYTRKVVPTQVVQEVEISQPTLEKEPVAVEEITTTIDGPKAVTASPDETEPDKVIYVHVEPAIDDYLGDGEMQAGGVEVVPVEEVEGRTEFIPMIEDEDYI